MPDLGRMETPLACLGMVPCLLAAFMLLTGCEETILGPELPRTYEAMLEEVWRTFDRYYPAFVVKEVAWAEVYEAHRAGLAGLSDDRHFFTALCKMLEELEDAHVSVTAPYGTCLFSGVFTPAHYFNPALVRSDYVVGAKTTPVSGLTYGRMSESVGYIHIRSFKTGEPAWSDDMDDVLEALGPIVSLILDVRDNSGGSLRLAEAVAGRFADKRRVYAYVEYRDGPQYTDLTEPEPVDIVPMGDRRFTGPIALLTNRHCFSACEGFVLAMGELPHVVSVGDTTGGGFGSPLGRELPNGWSYRVPAWLMSTSDRVYLEGVGIAPDASFVPAPSDAARSRDAILETALRLLDHR